MHSGHMQSPVQAEALEASLSCSLLCFSYVSLVADIGVGGISPGGEGIGWPAHSAAWLLSNKALWNPSYDYETGMLTRK